MNEYLLPVILTSGLLVFYSGLRIRRRMNQRRFDRACTEALDHARKMVQAMENNDMTSFEHHKEQCDACAATMRRENDNL